LLALFIQLYDKTDEKLDELKVVAGLFNGNIMKNKLELRALFEFFLELVEWKMRKLMKQIENLCEDSLEVYLLLLIYFFKI
jgi:hypothetical protein